MQDSSTPTATPAWKPGGDDFRAAQQRIKPHIFTTPLLRAEALERDGRRVFVKPENLQKTGSFKVRGAFNALLSLEPDVRARGVIAFSSGNHGAAVAYAARELGAHERGQPYPCTIVVPEDANPVKLASMKRLGAEIIACGKTVDERKARALEIGAADGRDVVPSYDDRRVITGQGTIGLEVMDQWMARAVAHAQAVHGCRTCRRRRTNERRLRRAARPRLQRTDRWRGAGAGQRHLSLL